MIEKSWHTIFDVELATREPYAAEWALFEQHKTALLDILRKSYNGGPKSKPFDEQCAWRKLIIAAAWYFRRPEIKRNTLLPARRLERLNDLSKTLSNARKLVHDAMQDDVGIDLFRGWWTETNRNLSSISEQDIDAVADEITEAAAKVGRLRSCNKESGGKFTQEKWSTERNRHFIDARHNRLERFVSMDHW
jgi:hypothetical protein